MILSEIADDLAAMLGELTFSPPVVHVYNPLVYAREPHHRYLEQYGAGKKEVLFVGMNPGPWGMAQTGVPFGEVSVVGDWLGIHGVVTRPPDEHPKKRVEGFSCRRSEVSGRRLWGLFRDRFGEPEKFFDRFFVLNYCPLLFLDGEGRNITPDKLNAAERAKLLAACTVALRRSVECMRPEVVIGVGNFAAERAAEALAGMPLRVGKILHPSPANPLANKGWARIVVEELREQGVEL